MGATIMTQVYGSLELLWIKCSHLAAARAKAISQCWCPSLSEPGEPLVGSGQDYSWMNGEIM
jgi:hypothetical protein